jgi:molecular chaperone DnaK (HSP70)
LDSPVVIDTFARKIKFSVSIPCTGTRYMVVDCGGGTVDITVHELSECNGTLRELHKATGGPWGSMGERRSL